VRQGLDFGGNGRVGGQNEQLVDDRGIIVLEQGMSAQVAGRRWYAGTKLEHFVLPHIRQAEAHSAQSSAAGRHSPRLSLPCSGRLRVLPRCRPHGCAAYP
jgi:hypothetical protein